MYPSHLIALLTLLLASIVPGAAAHAVPRAEYRSSDPSAPPVTEVTLYQNERFWPYRASVTRPLEGAGAIGVGARGVLVRVEADGHARIDFGREGKREVPVEATDLVQRANEVRLGKAGKIAPNFVHVIGPRLLDAEAPSVRPYAFERAFLSSGFLAVHADPADPGFADLAAKLAPLQNRYGVLTVLFPLGRRPDPETYDRLKDLDWRVPFIMFHLAEGYTVSRLPDPIAPPAVMLQTPEGRVIFQSEWNPTVVPALTQALDDAFGPGDASGRTAQR